MKKKLTLFFCVAILCACGPAEEPTEGSRRSTKSPTPTVQTPPKSFEFSEAERKQIYREIVQVESRSSREAEERYPGAQNSSEYIELQRALVQLYNVEIRQHHPGLTKDAIVKIAAEGASKGWP